MSGALNAKQVADVGWALVDAEHACLHIRQTLCTGSMLKGYGLRDSVGADERRFIAAKLDSLADALRKMADVVNA